MRKLNAFTVTAGVVFLFALTASTVHADMVPADRFPGRLNGVEQRSINVSDTSRAESHAYLYAEHSSNGKHLGFGVASFRGGPKIGLVGHNPLRPTLTTENPEPATMILLGTGLAAVGAIVRRRKKV